MKRILCFLISISYVFGCIPAMASSSNTSLELHVEGRYIYNTKGEKVRLVGSNIVDLQWSTGVEKDVDERVEMLLDAWNVNCIRLCVHSKFWFGEEWYQNKDHTSYRKQIDYIINKAAARGKYVILNLHEFYFITEKNKRFWEDAAQVYKNNPTVIFGILNEPHDISWEVWRNGGYVETNDAFGKPSKIRSYGHQEMLDMIRGFGARNICIVGGLDWAYYYDGISKGYDGLEYGYRLQEPEGELKGNGIIYDSHIYPMKPEYIPVEKALDCIVDEVPILIGEYGHWGERLFDWYENYLLEYPHIWMNQMHDYIDRNELNYTTFAFHPTCAPALYVSHDTYEPTLYNGIYQKHRLLSTPDTRPPEGERIVDPSPLSTWERKLGFDNGEEVLVYGDYLQAEIVPDGLDKNSLFVNFDIKEGEGGKSAAIFDIPEGVDLSGAQWVSVQIKGDGDMRNVGFGIELDDGRQFLCDYPLDLYENWKLLFFPLGAFKGDVGILDTTKIKSFYVTPLDEGVGSFTLDDVIFGGVPYEKPVPIVVSEKTKKDTIRWYAWEDSESKNADSFTVVPATGRLGGTAVSFNYDRPEGSYGGQSRGQIPASWFADMKKTDYITFWAKGNGTRQLFTMRFDCQSSTTFKDQRSNFKKREFERFAVDFEVTGNDWKFYKIRFSDLGLSDMLHKDMIRYVDFFNRIEGKKGSLTVSDFSFTNIGDTLEESYISHEKPKPSAPIGEVKTKFPQNQIVQVPKTFEITAGKDEYIHIHIMNKTDKDIKGELKIEGLPLQNYDFKAKYEVYANNVSFPHYPWRSYSYSNFRINIPRSRAGEYTITVSDNSDNGVMPQQYKLIVKQPAAEGE